MELSLEKYLSSPSPSINVSFFVDEADRRSLIDMVSFMSEWISYSTDVAALFCLVLFFCDWSLYRSNTTRTSSYPLTMFWMRSLNVSWRSNSVCISVLLFHALKYNHDINNEDFYSGVCLFYTISLSQVLLNEVLLNIVKGLGIHIFKCFHLPITCTKEWGIIVVSNYPIVCPSFGTKCGRLPCMIRNLLSNSHSSRSLPTLCPTYTFCLSIQLKKGFRFLFFIVSHTESFDVTFKRSETNSSYRFWPSSVN